MSVRPCFCVCACIGAEVYEKLKLPDYTYIKIYALSWIKEAIEKGEKEHQSALL